MIAGGAGFKTPLSIAPFAGIGIRRDGQLSGTEISGEFHPRQFSEMPASPQPIENNFDRGTPPGIAAVLADTGQE
jgi:hypothetical protein